MDLQAFSLKDSLNCPEFELPPPEVGRTSRGFMKKYLTEFKLKVVTSFLAARTHVRAVEIQLLDGALVELNKSVIAHQ